MFSSPGNTHWNHTCFHSLLSLPHASSRLVYNLNGDFPAFQMSALKKLVHPFFWIKVKQGFSHLSTWAKHKHTQHWISNPVTRQRKTTTETEEKQQDLEDRSLFSEASITITAVSFILGEQRWPFTSRWGRNKSTAPTTWKTHSKTTTLYSWSIQLGWNRAC